MTANPAVTIVSLARRPDLAPLVARWIWEAFWQAEGFGLAQVEALVADAAAGDPIPQSFVLLADGQPVGTAALVAHDLDQRPDLTPWLAAVFVRPDTRDRGYASRLVDAVEAAARAASVARLWLYTRTAEPLYAKAGWDTVGPFEHMGMTHVLMSKALIPQPVTPDGRAAPAG